MPGQTEPFDDSPKRYFVKPLGNTFVVVDSLDTSKVGVRDLTDVAKGQILLGNPDYIAANKADLDSMQVEWNTVHRDTGFADFIVDGFGNLAAGFVNGIIPGSNLGDQNNPSQIIGQVASSFVPVGGIVGNLGIVKKIESMSVFSGIGNFANKLVNGGVMSKIITPIASNVASSYLQNALSGSNVAAPNQAAQVSPYQTLGEITKSTGNAIANSAFGDSTPTGINPFASGQQTKTASKSNTMMYVIGAIVAVVVLFLGVFMFKRKR